MTSSKAVLFYCSFFVVLLFSINAGAMNYSSAWAKLALLYYKDFPYHKVKDSAPVPGCTLRTVPAQSHHTLWHCQEKIYLLRPLSEVASWNKEQGCFTLRFSTLKINHIRAKITSFHILKNVPDLSEKDHMPVTGIFITHTVRVKQYKFRHVNTGHISTIRATPDHPFHLQKSRSFVPVSQLTSANSLLNNQNETIRIICPKGRTINCGLSGDNLLPAAVYNLEVYKKHAFYAGDKKILVHNCTPSLSVRSPPPANAPISIASKTVPYNRMHPPGPRLKRTRLRIDSVNMVLSKMAEKMDINDLGRTAYYDWPDSVFYEFSENSPIMICSYPLYSRTLKPREIGDLMSTVREFRHAKTLFIANYGLSESYSSDEAAAFIQYFQVIANHTGKDVIFNLEGKIGSHEIKTAVIKYMEFGLEHEQTGIFCPNYPGPIRPMRVHPDPSVRFGK